MKRFLVVAALALGACVNVLPKAAPASPRFQISAIESAGDASETPVDWTLVVEDPQASRVYDNTKIALAQEPGRIEFYASGEWADRAPRLFQSALIRSFENTGRILGVGDRVTQPLGDYFLQTDIRRMEADIDGGSVKAVFSVYARLVNGRGKVLAGKLFQAEKDAGGNSGAAAAKAMDEAVQTAMTEILAWTFETGENAIVGGAGAQRS